MPCGYALRYQANSAISCSRVSGSSADMIADSLLQVVGRQGGGSIRVWVWFGLAWLSLAWLGLVWLMQRCNGLANHNQQTQRQQQ